MKKIILVILIFALTASLLPGCGSRKSSNGKISSTEKNNPVKIEFFNMKYEVSDIMNELISGFQKENPGLIIEQNIAQNPLPILQTRMASGDTPELFTQWPDATWRRQVDQGFMLDLTGEKCIAGIQKSVLEQYRINGRDYIAPVSYNTLGIYYNRRIFSELDLSMPMTFKELIHACGKIKAAGMTPFIIQGKDADAMLQEWYTLLPSISGYDQFIKDTAAGDLKLAARKDQLVKITEKFLDIASFAQPDMMSTGTDQGVIDFANEKGAMLIMGSWKIGLIKKANPELDFEMFPMPADTAEGIMAAAFPGDMALCISSTAPHSEEAKKFIEYVTRPENAGIYAERDGSPSCIKGVDVIAPQLAKQYNLLQEGKFKINPDANWMSNTNQLIGIAVQKLIIDKNIDKFLNALDCAYKEGVRN